MGETFFPIDASKEYGSDEVGEDEVRENA